MTSQGRLAQWWPDGERALTSGYSVANGMATGGCAGDLTLVAELRNFLPVSKADAEPVTTTVTRSDARTDSRLVKHNVVVGVRWGKQNKPPEILVL
jgi:hypothetical protein